MRVPLISGVAVIATLLLSSCHDSNSDDAATTAGNNATQCVPDATTFSEQSPPPIEHVFVIVLENKSFDETYGPESPAEFLRDTLVPQGQLLTHFYGTSHASTGNYISMLGGQAPNPASHGDCAVFAQWTPYNPADPNAPLAFGQANGTGCLYPDNFPTLVDEMELHNSLYNTTYTWRGWMEDMALEQSGAPRAEGRPEDNTCVSPPENQLDETNGSDETEQYAARHNPFLSYRSIIGDGVSAEDLARCDANVIDLEAGSPSQGLPGLAEALVSRATTPNYNLIVPDNCHNAHDSAQQCEGTSGGPGGLAEADLFLKHWVPLITASPAFQQAGMLIIFFDEANFGQGSAEDFDACCGQEILVDGGLQKHGGSDPGLNGLLGPGGGRFGAVVLSPFTQPGIQNDTPYNHYSLLRTIENLLGLDKIHIDPADNTADPETEGYIGYAGLPAEEGMHAFGSDVYNCNPDG